MSNIKLYRKTRFTIKRPIGSFRDLEVSGNIKLSGRIRQGSLGDVPRPFDTRCKLYAKGRGVAEMMALSPMVIAHTSSLRGSETTYRVIASEAKQSFEIASSVASLLPRNDMAFAMPQPNDVVMIDRDGGIRLSDGPNSTAVIGVISVNPAQILLEYYIYFVHERLNYINKKEHDGLSELRNEVGRMLNGLIRSTGGRKYAAGI